MKSITIHKLDHEVAQALEQQSKLRGLSLNQLVKDLLRVALGLGNLTQDRRADFEEFCGKWSATDEAEFRQALADFEEIRPEEWESKI